jgi:hypothetical protein
MRIKHVIIIFSLTALLWACSTAPKIPSPPPTKIEAKGTISFKMISGQFWRVLDTGQEKFAVFPLKDCQLDLPPEDIKITPTSVSWNLRGDLLYVVRGYTGASISLPDVGVIRRINANYIGTVK